jgi:peptidoglycan/xylan/chitin deacetylase (PgdA/CDA1 family)
MRVKRLLYRAAKACGVFALARRLTAERLRILAYHGNELCDESAFMPIVFMRRETFAARLRLLRERGYPVLALGEAVQRLNDGTLPPCAVAITIDDGFHSTGAVAAPLLHEARMPATLYVTTWYTQRDAPVFRLAMQYCFFRTKVTTVELGQVSDVAAGTVAVDGELLWELVNFGEQQLDEAGRAALLERTAKALGVDLQPVLARRAFHLMTPAELARAAEALDLQLHTHRHRAPADPVRVRAEIEENRTALKPVARNPLVHFCYPSGYHSPKMFPWLKSAGIETATTCEPGLNAKGTHPYALKRFLDGEHVSLLEFEAELSGFAELLRLVRARLRPERPVVAPDEAEERRGYPAGSGRSLGDRVRRAGPRERVA